MDTLKQNGKIKYLKGVLYFFLSIAGIHFFSILTYFCISNELSIGLSLFIAVICYPIEWIIVLFAIIYYFITSRKIYGFWHIVVVSIVLIGMFIFMLSANHDWKDEKKQQFLEECEKTDSIRNLSITLSGFVFNETDKILVQQIHENQIIDSFYITPDINSYDSIRSTYNVDIEKSLYIRDSYCFIVQQKTFVLSNMKMVLHPEVTMLSANYGCVVGEYTINGISFENMSPNFINYGE